MKLFRRSLLVTSAPLFAATVTLVGSALVITFGCDNPVVDRVNQSVKQHFIQRKNFPVSVFHNNVFRATKDIAKDQKLTADQLEREFYSGMDEDPRKVNHYNEAILGARAQKAIATGALIFATDLADFVHSDKKPADADESIPVNQDHSVTSCLMTIIGVITAVGFACTWCSSQIWLIVFAFRKSTMWGISSLLLPPVAGIFQIRNWEETKKVFPLQVISVAFAGLFMGGFIGVELKLGVLEDQLGKTVTVLYAKKDLQAGTVISEEDFTEIEFRRMKAPQDALNDKSLAIGHKLQNPISKGMMIGTHDVAE